MQAADRFVPPALLRKSHPTEPAKEVLWRRGGNTGVTHAGHNSRFLIIFLRTLRHMLGSISNDASKFFPIPYSLKIVTFHVNNMSQFCVIQELYISTILMLYFSICVRWYITGTVLKSITDITWFVISYTTIVALAPL